MRTVQQVDEEITQIEWEIMDLQDLKQQLEDEALEIEEAEQP